eukprot:137572-Rhodomonas_salina.1
MTDIRHARGHQPLRLLLRPLSCTPPPDSEATPQPVQPPSRGAASGCDVECCLLGRLVEHGEGRELGVEAEVVEAREARVPVVGLDLHPHAVHLLHRPVLLLPTPHTPHRDQSRPHAPRQVCSAADTYRHASSTHGSDNPLPLPPPPRPTAPRQTACASARTPGVRAHRRNDREALDVRVEAGGGYAVLPLHQRLRLQVAAQPPLRPRL